MLFFGSWLMPLSCAGSEDFFLKTFGRKGPEIRDFCSASLGAQQVLLASAMGCGATKEWGNILGCLWGNREVTSLLNSHVSGMNSAPAFMVGSVDEVRSLGYRYSLRTH